MMKEEFKRSSDEYGGESTPVKTEESKKDTFLLNIQNETAQKQQSVS